MEEQLRTAFIQRGLGGLEGTRRNWGGKRESNPQPPEPQSGALPVELFPPQVFNYSNRIAVGRAALRRVAGSA